ncbi:MAG TPA: heparin lyase I family protein [Rhizomicrobium sp.]|nr:heparin lyase I family protein [Rhizomicrobium sp.]
MKSIGVASCMLVFLPAGIVHAGPLDKAPVNVGGQIYFAQNADRDWSLNLNGSPPCLYRFEVRAGDRWVQETANNSGVERSELRGPTDENDPARFGAETWTAYQFRIEPGAPSSAEWVVLGDWHVRPDPEDSPKISSPWQLELRRGDILVFDIRENNEKPIRHNAPELHLYTSPEPVSRGIWHSIVSVADFDPRVDGSGGVTVWLDGKEIVNYHGPFGYITTRPPYFKFGIYRSDAPETLAVDYANIETSRASLAARIHAPPPVCPSK